MLRLLAAAALTISTAASAPRNEGHASLIAFADAFDRAQLGKDAAALDRMIADDLIFIDGAGVRRDKKAFIAGWTASGDVFEPIILIDRTVTQLGDDVGIVGAEVALTGVSNQKRFSSRFRFADTFTKTSGHWRAVHIQVTRIA